MPILGGSGSSASELVEILREQAGEFPHRDTLNGALTSSTTAVVFTSGSQIAPNSLIEVDLEVIRVTAKASATNGTIARAQEGSTAAAHADGAEVLTAFRHSRLTYLRALNASLDAISLGFGLRSWDETGTYDATTTLYSVPEEAQHVFAVAYKPGGYTSLEPVPFRFHPSLPTSVISTGKGVELLAYIGDGTVYVGYEEAWPQLADLSASLDVSYPADAIDLVLLGAKWWLADAESFERIAMSQPHARLHTSLSSSAEVRLEAQSNAQDFIVRRSDLATREHHDPIAWMRG